MASGNTFKRPKPLMLKQNLGSRQLCGGASFKGQSKCKDAVVSGSDSRQLILGEAGPEHRCSWNDQSKASAAASPSSIGNHISRLKLAHFSVSLGRGFWDPPNPFLADDGESSCMLSEHCVSIPMSHTRSTHSMSAIHMHGEPRPLFYRKLGQF